MEMTSTDEMDGPDIGRVTKQGAWRHGVQWVIALIAFAAISAQTTAMDKLPETTADGLVLKHDTGLSAVYVKPGASLKAYQRIYLVDCFVAFRKDWQRDYNRDHFSSRVTDTDLQKIKEAIADEFRDELTKVLAEGGYTVTEQIAGDVMILRPAIIDLQITAPDVGMSMSRTIVGEAGTMTLYMEFYDAVTSAKFAQVFDAEVVGDRSFGYVANRTTNLSELDRTLRAWAQILVKRLDEAHEATAP
jgi:hypothetical protein